MSETQCLTLNAVIGEDLRRAGLVSAKVHVVSEKASVKTTLVGY
jgi:hypothetical protein